MSSVSTTSSPDAPKGAPECALSVRGNIIEFLRSRSFLGFVVSVAVILAVAFAFFWPDAIEGNELRQHDTQQGIAISHESEVYRDLTGETPRWTNALFSGMPTFQISPSYSSGGLIKAVERAYSLWLPSPVNLLFIMMLGFFILLVSMRVKWYLALPGAIAYGLSSYFVIIIGAGHIWKFITLAYIPPTIAGMVLAYRGRYLAGGALAALFAMFQISGNHIQMSYYFLMVVIGFAVAYGIMLYRDKRMGQWWKATGSLAIAAILAVMANSPNLYNTYEYSKETMRGRHSELSGQSAGGSVGESGGLNKDYITAWSYGKDETFTLLIPNVKGGATIKPEQGTNKFLTLYDVPAAQDMVASGKISGDMAGALQQLPQYFGDQPMTNGPVYVGALVLALFLLGCIIVKGPLKWMLVIVTIISIALSWGHNMMWLTDLMIDYFPMYNKFRTVASILVVAEFTIPLLAILAVKELIDRRDEWKRFRRPIFISFGLCLLVCLLGIISPGIFGSFLSDQEAQAYGSYLTQAPYSTIFAAAQTVRMSMISTDALRSFIFIALGGGIVYMFLLGKLKVTVLCALLSALITVDMFVVDKRYLDTESFVPRSLTRGEPFPLTAADREILQDTAMNYRVMNIPEFSQAAPSYRHKTIGGYHAAKLTRYQDLIDRHLGNFTTNQISEADMNVLNMLNAKYVVLGNDEVVRNPDALGNAWFVDTVAYVADADAEMDALDYINPSREAVSDSRFRDVLGTDMVSPTPGDTIYETSYSPDRLTYKARSAKGGIAVFSEVYFPWGWKAFVGDEETPIARVDYVLRAIKVPAGEHDITMVFDPASVKATTAISYIGIVLIYLSVVCAVIFTFIGCRRGKDKSQS
ncbi:MAG: hypothetical protein NC127_01470 [Muribaculum sp.]|nr:hypothetical protein [Muribaculum sp.]